MILPIDFFDNDDWEELSEEMKEEIKKREFAKVMVKIEERKKHNEYMFTFDDFYYNLEQERKRKGNKENESPRFMGVRIFQEKK